MGYYFHVNNYENSFNSTYYSAFIKCLAQSNIFLPCNCWHCLDKHVRRNSCDSLPTVVAFCVIKTLRLIGPVHYMQTHVTLYSTLTHELFLSFLKLPTGVQEHIRTSELKVSSTGVCSYDLTSTGFENHRFFTLT